MVANTIKHRFTDTGSSPSAIVRAGSFIKMNMDTGGAFTIGVQVKDDDTGSSYENWQTHETVTTDYGKVWIEVGGEEMRFNCTAHSDTGNEAFCTLKPPQGVYQDTGEPRTAANAD